MIKTVKSSNDSNWNKRRWTVHDQTDYKFQEIEECPEKKKFTVRWHILSLFSSSGDPGLQIYCTTWRLTLAWFTYLNKCETFFKIIVWLVQIVWACRTITRSFQNICFKKFKSHRSRSTLFCCNINIYKTGLNLWPDSCTRLCVTIKCVVLRHTLICFYNRSINVAIQMLFETLRF